MWKRYRRSLTARTFAITFVFTMLACLITYAGIAGLTPISYTFLLEDELDQKAEELISSLALGTSDESQELLTAFSEHTGTDIRLTYPEIIQYDILAGEGDPFVGESVYTDGSYSFAANPEDVTSPGEQDIWYYSAANADLSEDAGFVAENPRSNVYERKYEISFSDGRTAILEIKRVHTAVVQASEAIRKLLPVMLIAALTLSVLVAMIYSRTITKPVVSLSKIANRMSMQDFSVRWHGKQTDEIGELGNSLNMLSENLSNALNQLTEANAVLHRQIDREREFEQQRSSFFAAASHELKTPVTVLKGQLSGMLEGVGVYRDRDKYLARALLVTGRMEHLIQDILTISHLRSDDLHIRSGNADISLLLREMVDEYDELISGKQMILDTDISDPVIIGGNEQLLRNAIGNVLMNAILYSPEGATIRIRLNNERLLIENTQTSIDPNDLAHLCEPFYRVESSRNRATGGSGLGLYIVDCIMKQHELPYEISNTTDGVCFTIFFKIKSEIE